MEIHVGERILVIPDDATITTENGSVYIDTKGKGFRTEAMARELTPIALALAQTRVMRSHTPLDRRYIRDVFMGALTLGASYRAGRRGRLWAELVLDRIQRFLRA